MIWSMNKKTGAIWYTEIEFHWVFYAYDIVPNKVNLSKFWVAVSKLVLQIIAMTCFTKHEVIFNTFL